jgi:hypothetical protein
MHNVVKFPSSPPPPKGKNFERGFGKNLDKAAVK